MVLERGDQHRGPRPVLLVGGDLLPRAIRSPRVVGRRPQHACGRRAGHCELIVTSSDVDGARRNDRQVGNPCNQRVIDRARGHASDRVLRFEAERVMHRCLVGDGGRHDQVVTEGSHLQRRHERADLALVVGVGTVVGQHHQPVPIPDPRLHLRDQLRIDHDGSYAMAPSRPLGRNGQYHHQHRAPSSCFPVGQQVAALVAHRHPQALQGVGQHAVAPLLLAMGQVHEHLRSWRQRDRGSQLAGDRGDLLCGRMQVDVRAEPDLVPCRQDGRELRVVDHERDYALRRGALPRCAYGRN